MTTMLLHCESFNGEVLFERECNSYSCKSSEECDGVAEEAYEEGEDG